MSHESPPSFITCACGSIVSQQSPDIPVRLSHRNPPVYLLTVTFPSAGLQLAFRRDHNDAQSVINIFDRMYLELGPDTFIKLFPVLLADNGSEFSDCEGMETSIFGGQRTKMYYCHPYSSYERGSNENLNKMFRRLFPKGTNFDEVPDEEIIAAADWMNNYPREILGRTTAARVFNEQLAQITA